MSYQKIALPLAEEVIKRTKLPDTLPVAGRGAARLYNEVFVCIQFDLSDYAC